MKEFNISAFYMNEICMACVEDNCVKYLSADDYIKYLTDIPKIDHTCGYLYNTLYGAAGAGSAAIDVWRKAQRGAEGSNGTH